MSTIPSPPTVLTELAYGSVWLVGTGDGDRRHLLPLAEHALGTADAVIHDPDIPQSILALVRPPRYRESAEPRRAIERSIKLARDGWRVVHLVEGSAMERAIECAARFAERNVPLRIVPAAGEPFADDVPIGLLLVRKPLLVGRTATATAVVVVASQSATATSAEPRQAPVSFSMCGLAG